MINLLELIDTWDEKGKNKPQNAYTMFHTSGLD